MAVAVGEQESLTRAYAKQAVGISGDRWENAKVGDTQAVLDFDGRLLESSRADRALDGRVVAMAAVRWCSAASRW